MASEIVDTVNLDIIEINRLSGIADEARRQIKKIRLRIAIVDCYGSWSNFVEKMLEDGEIL